MSVSHGNKIFVINYMGVICGIAHSLDVTIDYGPQGIYDFSKKYELKNGNTKVISHLTATLHGLHLGHVKYSDIDIIRIEDVAGKDIDYQVVGDKTKGNELTLPVWLCNY